jgi:MFS family permease
MSITTEYGPSGPVEPAALTPPPVPHRWRSLAVMTGVELIDNTESGVTTTVFPSIAKSLGLNAGHLGLISALGKVAAVPLGPLWVWLGTKIGRKSALSLASLLAGVTGIMAGFSHDFISLLVWNTLLAAILNGAQPVTNAVIADAFPDKQRGKATGYYYGVLNTVASFVGPLIALFTRQPDGWRLAMWTIGALCLVVTGLMQWLFVDPKVGATESELAGLSDPTKALNRVTWSGVMTLFRIPSFNIMMISRLLSGHLLISVFGIQFLVTERGFSNVVAATVLIPFGIGYAITTFLGGLLVSWLDKVWEHKGRIAYIIVAQVVFAVAAFFGTQFIWPSIFWYGLWWALMGGGQGLNPSVNRPIVMSIVEPQLRGQAFAIFLSIFQTIGWAVFSYGAGSMAVKIGIQASFNLFLVWLMLFNAAFLGLLFIWYRKDVEKVRDAMRERRAAAVSG